MHTESHHSGRDRRITGAKTQLSRFAEDLFSKECDRTGHSYSVLVWSSQWMSVCVCVCVCVCVHVYITHTQTIKQIQHSHRTVQSTLLSSLEQLPPGGKSLHLYISTSRTSLHRLNHSALCDWHLLLDVAVLWFFLPKAYIISSFLLAK